MAWVANRSTTVRKAVSAITSSRASVPEAFRPTSMPGINDAARARELVIAFDLSGALCASMCLSLSGSERLEIGQHGREQLGDRRMDVRGALHHGVGRLGVHEGQDGVDHLVAADAEN